jgi:YebC/PmpR family DNA-binding regulatory protein
MSGHSKWAKTHRQKSLQDSKRGAVFTKLANLITVAAKEGGGDPETNFKLRLAVEKARNANMPKDNVERAINRGTGEGKDGQVFEEITYEIIIPGGIYFIIEALTDNKNRTVSDLKAILNRNNAQLGATNSAAWNFKRCGLIVLDGSDFSDEAELTMIDAGVEDIIKDEDSWELITAPEALMPTAEKLKQAGLNIAEASLVYLPNEEKLIEDENEIEKIDKLYSAVDNLDDVSNLYTNAKW